MREWPILRPGRACPGNDDPCAVSQDFRIKRRWRRLGISTGRGAGAGLPPASDSWCPAGSDSNSLWIRCSRGATSTRLKIASMCLSYCRRRGPLIALLAALCGTFLKIEGYLPDIQGYSTGFDRPRTLLIANDAMVMPGLAHRPRCDRA
jgi:hypothetical protein